MFTFSLTHSFRTTSSLNEDLGVLSPSHLTRGESRMNAKFSFLKSEDRGHRVHQSRPPSSASCSAMITTKCWQHSQTVSSLLTAVVSVQEICEMVKVDRVPSCHCKICCCPLTRRPRVISVLIHVFNALSETYFPLTP